MNPTLIANNILDMMNRAFQADSNAMHALICNRIPCNNELADDTSVVCEASRVLTNANSATVGLLGIVNGILLECDSDTLLAAKFEQGPGNKNTLVGFQLVEKDKVIL